MCDWHIRNQPPDQAFHRARFRRVDGPERSAELRISMNTKNRSDPPCAPSELKRFRMAGWIVLGLATFVVTMIIAFGDAPRAFVDQMNLVLAPIVVAALCVAAYALWRFRRACRAWREEKQVEASGSLCGRKEAAMSVRRSSFRERLPWGIFLVIVLMTGWDAVFMRFIHYHAQNRALRPDDYDIQVVTAEDHRALSDPSQTSVQLSDGTRLTKGAAWDSAMFKAVRDGAFHAKVTTKGTAHILDQALPKSLLVLLLGIVGMILSWPRACRAEPDLC